MAKPPKEKGGGETLHVANFKAEPITGEADVLADLFGMLLEDRPADRERLRGTGRLCFPFDPAGFSVIDIGDALCLVQLDNPDLDLGLEVTADGDVKPPEGDVIISAAYKEGANVFVRYVWTVADGTFSINVGGAGSAEQPSIVGMLSINATVTFPGTQFAIFWRPPAQKGQKKERSQKLWEFGQQNSAATFIVETAPQ